MNNQITCPKCYGYLPGHATGSADICSCKPLTTTSAQSEPLPPKAAQDIAAVIRRLDTVLLVFRNDLVALKIKCFPCDGCNGTGRIQHDIPSVFVPGICPKCMGGGHRVP